jgi:hypothetical protein
VHIQWFIKVTLFYFLLLLIDFAGHLHENENSNNENTTIEVAIKVPHDDENVQTNVDFLKEIEFMMVR